ncbi:MAG: SBBP repeat-containing protein [Thermodesulfobacteriota bacterium]
MKSWLRTWVVTGIAVVALLAIEFPLPLRKRHVVSANVKHQQEAKRLDSLQIPFVINEGQVDEEVSFYAKTICSTFFVTRNGEMVYAMGGREVAGRDGKDDEQGQNTTIIVLKEHLVSAKEIVPKGTDRAESRVSYFIGNDRTKWQTDIVTYNIVSISRAYENIDLSLKAYGRKVEKVFTVHPGGNVGDIRLGFEGATALKTNAAGELEVGIDCSEFRVPGSEFVLFSAPIAFQKINGKRKEVQVAYDVRGGTEYGFRVGEYDHRYPLIIDPKLEFSTYLGGSGFDLCHELVLDPSGNVYLTGYTRSSDFPTKNPFQGTHGGGLEDAFVAKLSASCNTLIYSTYLGGNGEDIAQGITVDRSGNAYVTGYTKSNNFPTLNAYQGTFVGGQSDAFVTKLNSSGNLVYSTYLGGTLQDSGNSIAVDASGSANVTGSTSSADFPILNFYLGAHQGGESDVFITKFSPAGDTLAYSTYLGGSGNEAGSAIKVDGSGNAYVVGFTISNNFPTLNAYQGSFQGGARDAFVTKLSPAGNSLLYSTYLGGGDEEFAETLAIDSSGNAYVAGRTASSNFPMLNPYQGTYQGGNDCFVAKLGPSGSSLVFSTYLGGSGGDDGTSIGIDGAGNVYVAGLTSSLNFPLRNAIQAGYQGGTYDGFVVKFNPSANTILYSTYLGGSGYDSIQSLVVGQGDVYVAGYTESTDFPIKNPFQGTYGGGTNDAFVAKISPVVKAKMFYFSPVHNLKE